MKGCFRKINWELLKVKWIYRWATTKVLHNQDTEDLETHVTCRSHHIVKCGKVCVCSLTIYLGLLHTHTHTCTRIWFVSPRFLHILFVTCTVFCWDKLFFVFRNIWFKSSLEVCLLLRLSSNYRCVYILLRSSSFICCSGTN